MNKSALHLPSLDGIRAASFLLVFAAHAGLGHIVPGGFGVTVFFFLSGYLITTLLRIERIESGSVSLRQFYWRRTLRILPAFYLVLGGAAIAAEMGVVAGGVDARALAAQALHLANYWIVLHGYTGQPLGTGVYWSLAVEEHFYLLFPMLYIVMARFVSAPGKQAAALWAVCALVLGWRSVLVYGFGAATDRTYVATDTRVDSILFGCALALFGNPALDGASRFSEAVWKRRLLPAALLVLLGTFVVRDPQLRETLRYSLQGIALIPPFVVALRYPSWGPFRILNLRAVAFLGVLSYPLYLVHHVVLEALSPAFGVTALRALVALLLSTTIAWTLYELVERPIARLRRRLSTTTRDAPAASAAPSVAQLAQARDL